MKLTTLKDFTFTEKGEDIIIPEVFILKIINEGNKETKLPFRVLLGIEETGEKIQAISWNFLLLEILKEEKEGKSLFSLEGHASIFRGIEQIKILNFKKLEEKISSRKIVKEKISEEELKKTIEILIEKIKDPDLKSITTNLILKEKDFFKWPAASKMHHGFPSGLVLHSFHVTKLALLMSVLYKNDSDIFNKDLLIAGGLLHDIGKLEEYYEDGKKTIFADLQGHISIGFEKVSNEAKKLGCESNEMVNLLKHIILSHHGKKEFGSTVTPIIPEAYLISMADDSDAKIGGLIEKYETLNELEISFFPNFESGKLMKWKKE